MGSLRNTVSIIKISGCFIFINVDFKNYIVLPWVKEIWCEGKWKLGAIVSKSKIFISLNL